MSNETNNAEPSGADGGSQRPPWALIHDNERLRDKIAMLRLTDEEREAIELAAGDYLYHQDAGGRAQWIRTTLLGLLERLK